MTATVKQTTVIGTAIKVKHFAVKEAFGKAKEQIPQKMVVEAATIRGCLIVQG